MLSKYVWNKAAQENYSGIVGPECAVIFSQEDNPCNVVLICLGQHSIWKQLCTGKNSRILSGPIWANIAQGNYFCNVDAWLTDSVYQENNLYNAVSTILRYHSIRILSSQCCPKNAVVVLNVGSQFFNRVTPHQIFLAFLLNVCSLNIDFNKSLAGEKNQLCPRRPETFKTLFFKIRSF